MALNAYVAGSFRALHAAKDYDGSAFDSRIGYVWDGTKFIPAATEPISIWNVVITSLTRVATIGWNPNAAAQLVGGALPPGYPAGGYTGGMGLNWAPRWDGNPATIAANMNFTSPVSTTLSGSVLAGASTYPVVDAFGFPTTGSFTVGTDTVTYTGISTNTFTGCTGGVSGWPSGQAVHASENEIYFQPLTVHDPTTELPILRALWDCKVATGLTTFDALIAELTPIVYQEWWKGNYYKAWPYFELLKLHTRQTSQGWDQAALYQAASVLTFSYQPADGSLVYLNGNSSSPSYIYRVDYAWECAAMFLDAGLRFPAPSAYNSSTSYTKGTPAGIVTYGGNTWCCIHTPTLGVTPGTDSTKWAQTDTYGTAGSKLVTYLVSGAVTGTGVFNPTTGLPPLQMNYVGGGADTVSSTQCKPGETGGILNFMLKCYQLGGSTNSALLTAATTFASTAVSASLGWYNPNGPLFYASVNWDGTGLNTYYQEGGRSAWWLRAWNQMLAIQPSGSATNGMTWLELRDNMLLKNAVRDYQTVGQNNGYVYRMSSDQTEVYAGGLPGYSNFSPYSYPVGYAPYPSGEFSETSEAVGIACGALLDHLLNQS